MERCQKKKRKELEKTGLSDLPDELILKIFSSLPFFKENLATRLISEYWEGPRKPEPNVMFDDRSHESLETSMSLIYGSLMSNDAQILEILHLKLGYNYSASEINFLVQVGVNRSVRELRLNLFGKTIELPCCLCTCRTLKELVLHNLSIKVVPPWFCLPSLKTLQLLSAKFSGDESVVSLLRICPVLERLVVDRTGDGNVMINNIIVPTLRSLSIDNMRTYWRTHAGESRGFLINAPSLMFLNMKNSFSNFIMFESMHELMKADIEVTHNQSEKLIESITSIRHLSLCSPTSEIPYPTGTKLSSLEHLTLCTCSAGWQNLLARMLNDAPKLRSLTLKSKHKVNYFSVCSKQKKHKVNFNHPKKLWKKLTVVPECLLTHLEILKWRGYVGTKHEKNLVKYILANATFLQKATFSTECRNQCDSRFRELKSMDRVSEKCQFVFAIRHLSLCSPTSENPYPTGTKFSSLEHLTLCTCSAGWQNLLACMLNDAPNLRSLTLKLKHKVNFNHPKKRWEKPTVVPECLLTHLEILKWRGYAGTMNEKNLVRYILTNATFLQKATFSTKCRNQCDSRFRELKSMDRVSEKCQFVFD